METEDESDAVSDITYFVLGILGKSPGNQETLSQVTKKIIENCYTICKFIFAEGNIINLITSHLLTAGSRCRPFNPRFSTVLQ